MHLKSLAGLLFTMGGCALTQAAVDPVDAEHLAYNVKTSVEAYDKAGRRNPKWDGEAKKCLMNFCRVRAWTNDSPHLVIQELRAGLGAAKELGCDDPLIRYLGLRFVDTPEGKASPAAFEQSAAALEKSGYPDIRKFYGTLWAGKSALKAAVPGSSMLVKAAAHLAKAMEDPSMPFREADQACELLMSASAWNDPIRWECYQALEKPLTNRWGGTSAAFLTKGRAYLSYAMKARGTGDPNTVPDAAMKQMVERAGIAAEALEAAWAQDPQDDHICLEMVRTQLADGKHRDRMETWFKRGMDINPQSHDLCMAKLEYLRPRWHGSLKEMIDFGRECTTRPASQGTVLLMLADAHNEVAGEIQDLNKRAAYWKQPKVWSDIQFTFDQFFKLHPEAAGYRHDYAQYAAYAGQWQVFLNQVRQFPSTNQAFFGGAEQFNRLLRQAGQNGQKASENQRP
jgi:hypothetical protein